MGICLLLIFIFSIREISGDCRKKTVVHCDKLNDYLKYETDEWRELTIGDVQQRPKENWTIFNVWRFLTQDLDQLDWLTIINQLHGQLMDQVRIDMKHDKLKYVHFYKNNLQNFNPYLFRYFPSLIELSLVDNNIRQIVSSSIGKIDTIDLSDNQLTEIKINSFLSMKIRRFIIKSNGLLNIEKNAFNASLQFLHLDSNEFSYVPEEGLENLENLKILTMSHNEIAFLPPNLSYLKSIERLDFSYNRINNVRTNFRQFSNLYHIDLSHNRIKQINFITLLPDNTFEKRISIAFNYLSQFQLDRDGWNFNFTSPVTLILFGNPWICKCLNEMDLFLKDRPFKRTKCDLELFGNGKFPSCVSQKLCLTLNLPLEISFYDKFIKTLEESKQYFTCNVDSDMLYLERNNRNFAFVSIPFSLRFVGNRTVAIW